MAYPIRLTADLMATHPRPDAPIWRGFFI